MNHDDLLMYVVHETLRMHGVTEDRCSSETTRICAHLRTELGGQEYYVPRKPPPLTRDPARRQKLITDALSPMPTREVEQRHGVSRATIYRLIKRHARGQP